MALLLLSGCASSAGLYFKVGEAPLAAAGLSAEIQRVGPLQVLLRPEPEVDMLCRLRAGERDVKGRILGCYVHGENLIISTPDAHVLLHELRHHFEGRFHN
ncbi:MAG TPA: hypothetical protein VFN71_15090 [Methylomirabilota bacterium]|nr:hypothetical protein [Methylomirabilota bacterium]